MNTTVKDPVCGVDVVPGAARGWDYFYDTETYHFCGPDCRSRFQADPKGMLKIGTNPMAVPVTSTESRMTKGWSIITRLFKGSKASDV